MSTNKYSYNYDEEAAEIEKKLEAEHVPPAEHKERDIQYHSVVGCILLCFIPIFGLFYQFYWMARLNDDIRDLANVYPSTPGWKVVLFHFLTLSLYTYYWLMKQGKRIDKIRIANGDRFNNSNGFGYLILQFFGFGFVAFAMMQSEVNNQL